MGSEWLTTQLLGRPPAADPRDELARLQATHAQLASDSEAVASEIAQLTEQLDERQREEAAETRQMFASGVRSPLVRKPSVNEQANAWLLAMTGREARRSGLR
jgi:hypothetical protein